MSVEQSINKYEIDQELRFVETKHGFRNIEINNAKARATISIYGGQVLSYRPITEPQDGLFVTPSELSGGEILASRRPPGGEGTHAVVRLDVASGRSLPKVAAAPGAARGKAVAEKRPVVTARHTPALQ